MRIKFEDFLREEHAKQYIGTKETLIDDFEKWLSECDIDKFLIYGDMFATELVGRATKKYTKKCLWDKEVR